MGFQTPFLKVTRDIWNQKAKTFLVVLSISIGVMGVGMIGQSLDVLNRGMSDAYTAAHPSSATLLASLFNDETVQKVKQMPDVEEADARTEVNGQIYAAQGQTLNVTAADWKQMQLIAIPIFLRLRWISCFLYKGCGPLLPGSCFWIRQLWITSMPRLAIR